MKNIKELILEKLEQDPNVSDTDLRRAYLAAQSAITETKSAIEEAKGAFQTAIIELPQHKSFAKVIEAKQELDSLEAGLAEAQELAAKLFPSSLLKEIEM